MQSLVLIIQLLPTIISIMRAIEEAIPDQGAGELKLAAVRQMLEIGNSTVDTIWPDVSKVISILVGLFNKTGWTKPT